MSPSSPLTTISLPITSPGLSGVRHAPDDAGNNIYTRANCYKQTWLAEGALLQDPEPALYVLEQQFSTPDGEMNITAGADCRAASDALR